MSPKDWGFALLIVFAWGFNFVVIHWGLNGLPPLLLGALRFSCVAFPAILFVPRPKIAWHWLLAYGLTISFGQFAFLFTAMKVGMPAGIASLVLQSQVLFTLLFASLFLSERWLAHQPVTLGIAACGLVVLATQQGQSGMTLSGFLLTIAAAACWGIGNIINRHITRKHQLNLLSLVVWSALIPPVPFSWPPTGWMAPACLCKVCKILRSALYWQWVIWRLLPLFMGTSPGDGYYAVIRLPPLRHLLYWCHWLVCYVLICFSMNSLLRLNG